MFSVLDMFTIGVGPSSSHTVGPMCAAQAFASSLEESGAVSRVCRIRVVLYGSLSLTGLGHGTDRAILAGLEGNVPATVDTDYLLSIRERCAHDGTIHVNGTNAIAYDDDGDMVFDRWKRLAPHPNGMRFQAFDAQGNIIDEQVWYSIGGGFIRRGRIDDALISNHEQTPASSQSPEDSGNDEAAEYGDGVPYPFVSCDGLIDLCRKHHLSIADVVWANETARRSPQEVRDRLTRIWNVMSHCIDAGCASATPTLPGGLDVPRRAPLMYRRLAANSDVLRRDRRISSALESSDSAWVALFAMSVSEENAGGGRVVTAPTNGSAGIIPAVLEYYWHFVESADDEGVRTFLLTAGAVGYLFKRNASISGAEVGCQGEVGVACSMACRWSGRGDGRHSGAGGERGGDRHRAQSRPHLRSGGRSGADSVHRAQRDGREHRDQRRAHGHARRWLPHRQPGSGHRHDEADRRGHDVEIQGDLEGRSGGQRRRMLGRRRAEYGEYGDLR